ncbi:MAG: L-histidine N(alpha)-methyltransferase [Ilumatobacteraceae bacterium]
MNILARLNRELDADFDLARFAHRASYDHASQRVEMHLVSQVAQRFAVNLTDDITDLCGGQRGCCRNVRRCGRCDGRSLQYHQDGDNGDDEAYGEADEGFHELQLLVGAGMRLLVQHVTTQVWHQGVTRSVSQ